MRIEAASHSSRTLSPYWRIDSSHDRARELSSVLGGAASMAEFVQYRLCETRPHRCVSAPVVLDPRLLAGFPAPVPGEIVDCVTGIAIREAGFRELSIDTSESACWNSLSEDQRTELRTTHRALEDYYVAARLHRLSPVLKAYLDARARILVAPLLDSWRRRADAPVTRTAILETWLACELYDEPLPDATTPELRRTVRAMSRLATPYLDRVDARERLVHAEDIWRWLQAYPPGIPYMFGAREQYSRSQSDEGRTRESADARMRKNSLGGNEAGGLTDLSIYLVDPDGPFEGDRPDDNAAPPEGTVRVTADLRELGVLAAETLVRDAEFEPEMYDLVREEVEREITSVRRLFRRLDEVESRWRYGVRRGKLDGRRLSRVASGKESVFKLRDTHHRSSMALVFLIDVSASMKSHMSTVNRSACVVAEALRGLNPEVWYEVLTYTSGGLHPGAPVQLTRLASAAKTLSLGRVWTEGGTPTGEAIAAALLRLRGQHARRRLILHFTDGHPKNTYVVRQALELCRREGVEVVTVSVGTPQETLYGAGRCEVAYTVAELPEVLHRLLPRLYR